MRLTAFQISQIREKVPAFFGQGSHVWLFGSRVDDEQKGGDIDLYIEPKIQDATALVDAKLKFLLEMHKVLGEQKIDVVLNRRKYGADLPIYQIAKETGKMLL